MPGEWWGVITIVDIKHNPGFPGVVPHLKDFTGYITNHYSEEAAYLFAIEEAKDERKNVSVHKFVMVKVDEHPPLRSNVTGYVLKEHQALAIEKMHNGCILAGGVGTGKTFTTLSYYVLKVCGGSLDRSTPMRTPKNVVVITTAKKRDSFDWLIEAAHLGIYPYDPNEDPDIVGPLPPEENIDAYGDEPPWDCVCPDEGCLHPKEPSIWDVSMDRREADVVGVSDSFDLFGGKLFSNRRSYGGVTISVDSWQNIQKHKIASDTFFIFDEQRLVGSGKWVKAFLEIAKHNEWVLLSATPADTWMDYLPVFLANGFYRNRTHFVEEHVIWTFHGRYRKIRGFYGVKRLNKLRDSIYVDMPYDRHTIRHLELVDVDFDPVQFDLVWKKLWNVYEDVPLLDSGEMHRIGRKVVNSDWSRVEKIEELSVKHPRMIVFYNFDYELEMLRTLHSKLDIVVAEWNGHRHEEVPETERWIYLVQYQAGAEGWNCTTTDTIIFYSLSYSHKLFEQARGRIDRLDTPFVDLWYYVLVSKAKIDTIIWRSVSTKKTFHEGRKIKFEQPEVSKFEAKWSKTA